MSQENKITRKSKQFSAANIYICRPGCFDAVKFRESKHSTERQSHQRQDFSSLVLVSQFDLQETLGHNPGSLTLMHSIEPGSYLVHTGSDTGTCFLFVKLRLIQGRVKRLCSWVTNLPAATAGAMLEVLWRNWLCAWSS